ncbi:hypothetical protein [Azohydromonas caseinilytica]|uniref:Uncharacterized protein n=1 Tax=Azohydromonas caseinilytica TaxID=2728836 RepID=A0A848FDA3_9BURK|nr:hypothetical protein [Azohydromonas caseinilytica]NML16976.1 hypothetical protein [Azohydromonas caseinilytica]
MSDIEVVQNPFDTAPAGARAVADGAGARAVQTRESAEVMALAMMAKRFPRDVLRATDRIRNAFTRQTLAEKAQYQYSRGGTDVVGPSIRAAEACAQQWGALSSGWREIGRHVGPDGVGVSEIEAFCLDHESNNREVIQFFVRHWRDTKHGGYRLKDERDIYELCANQAARRKRACILAQIPGDVIEMAMEQASATLRAKADTSPEGIKRLLDTFVGEFGVTKEQIERRIQRRIDSIQPAQVVGLKRIYVSLRDEMSTPADWFEPVEVSLAANDAQGEGGAGAAAQAPTAADKAKAMLRERARPPAAPAPAPAAEGEGQEAAVTPAAAPPAPARAMAPPPQARRGFDADAFAEQMQRAADKGDAETLDALGEQLRDVLDDDLRATLTDMHARLRADLGQPPRQQPPAAPVPPPRRRAAP